MNEAELYILIERTLKHYHYATLKNNRAGAYQIAIDLVELSQQLEELACDANKSKS
jgi:hypothetical protein